MRVLLDTNIILDFCLEREPFFQAANEIFDAIAKGQIEGFITASSATDIFYLCKRQTQNIAKAREIMTMILTLLSVCPVNGTILQTALNSGLTDFEDAVQIACAVAADLDAIATRNPKDFQTNAIAVLTVNQILEQAGT